MTGSNETMPTGSGPVRIPIEDIPGDKPIPGNTPKRVTLYWIFIEQKVVGDGETAMYVAEYPEAGIRIEHTSYAEADRLASHALHTWLGNCIRAKKPVVWKSEIGNPPEDAEVRKIAVAY